MSNFGPPEDFPTPEFAHCTQFWWGSVAVSEQAQLNFSIWPRRIDDHPRSQDLPPQDLVPVEIAVVGADESNFHLSWPGVFAIRAPEEIENGKWPFTVVLDDLGTEDEMVQVLAFHEVSVALADIMTRHLPLLIHNRKFKTAEQKCSDALSNGVGLSLGSVAVSLPSADVRTAIASASASLLGLGLGSLMSTLQLRTDFKKATDGYPSVVAGAEGLSLHIGRDFHRLFHREIGEDPDDFPYGEM
jgi:hypothetical protein